MISFMVFFSLVHTKTLSHCFPQANCGEQSLPPHNTVGPKNELQNLGFQLVLKVIRDEMG
jgi:hypothetical protein